MPGRSSGSRPLQVVGLLVAAVAVVGTVVLDWDFQRSAGDGLLPFALGGLAFVFALGYVIYSRVQR